MTRDLSEYVCLDGVYVKEEQVVKMAQNTGNFTVAEHYLCALLAHGLMYGKKDMIDRVNEVRDFYGVAKLPDASHDMSRNSGKYSDSMDNKVRAIYRKMVVEERREVLKHSLSLLRTDYHLFIYARHWLGVFLVIRDRLEGDALKMKDFIDYSYSIMPDDWPDSLRMGINTYKNFGREIDYNDKGEAYYDMVNCPQKELCETFWGILKQVILTTI